MKNSIKVRQVTMEDYKQIDSWYKKRGELRPKMIILPNDGLGGFVVEKDEKPIAVIYLYLTNSKMGYFDFLMSDPDYIKKDRSEIIMSLFHYCTKKAILTGCECVFVTTAVTGVINKMKELGVREDLICEDEKRIIIYTYESKNKVFI